MNGFLSVHRDSVVKSDQCNFTMLDILGFRQGTFTLTLTHPCVIIRAIKFYGIDVVENIYIKEIRSGL